MIINVKEGDLAYCDGLLGRVSKVDEEMQEVTIGNDWTVYLGDGLVTLRKADHRDINNILKGGEL